MTDSAKSKALLHELEVHQIELQMQNEQLRLSELKLSEARDRYFDLFDLAPVAYLTVDRSGVIVEANFAASTLLGRKRGALLARRLASHVIEEDAIPFHAFQEKLYQSGERQACELHLRRSGQRHMPVRMQGIALKNSAGEREHASIAIVDLSEIARAQKELAKKEEEVKRTEDRLVSFMSATSDCVLVLSAEGRIIEVNQPTLRMLGFSEQELIGRHIASLDHGVSPEVNIVESTELTWVDKDGRPHSMLLSISPIQSVGTPSEYLCTAQDVTESKAAKEKLSKSERLLREMAETIEDGFYVRESARGPLSYVSPAFERIFGRPLADFYRQPNLVLEQVHPDDVERLDFAFERFTKGDPWDEEYRIIHPDGAIRWIRERAFLVEGDEKGDTRSGRVVGIAQDITDQRQTELELRQGQKMEAIGQLASGVAHDFNNILMGIHGCASIGLSKLDEVSEVRPFLEAMRTSAENGTAIIKQLLAFSSKRELQIVTLDLSEMLASDKFMLARLLGDNIKLTLVPSQEPCPVRMDRGQMEQILMNLSINARDAMPTGGELTIETEHKSRCEFGEHGPLRGKYVELRVRDTGQGMSEEVQERIFEPFFTTKGIGEGTGLGLSTVYGIVQEAGGHIRCSSEEGVGTTFVVCLPRADVEDTQELGNRPDSEPGREGWGYTLLVVEDDETVRMATRIYLESEGYTVLEAPDGAEAIKVLDTSDVPIDLLLTDVGLPGFSGAGLAARARELVADLPVIFMSAHGADWLVEQGRLAAGENALQKPFSKRELLAKVGTVLDLH